MFEVARIVKQCMRPTLAVDEGNGDKIVLNINLVVLEAAFCLLHKLVFFFSPKFLLSSGSNQEHLGPGR